VRFLHSWAECIVCLHVMHYQKMGGGKFIYLMINVQCLVYLSFRECTCHFERICHDSFYWVHVYINNLIISAKLIKTEVQKMSYFPEPNPFGVLSSWVCLLSVFPGLVLQSKSLSLSGPEFVSLVPFSLYCDFSKFINLSLFPNGNYLS